MSFRTHRTPQRAREAFMDALDRGMTVSGACKAASMGRSTAYGLRATDEAFAKAWDEALENGTDVLEDEAFRRACEGVLEPIVSGGRQVLDTEGKPMMQRRFSDNLMVTLLKARRPERFRERSTVDSTVTVAADSGPVIREVLQSMTQQERDVLRGVLERQVAQESTGVTGPV